MWKTLRVTPIQLCEDIIKDCASLKDTESMAELGRAKEVIVEMTREICAACPQMTNCSFAARQKLPDGALPGAHHTHTQSHILDVYIIIFGLYVVTWAQNCPAVAKKWAIRQLEHIADHFGIGEAANILVILHNQQGGVTGHSWYAYIFLG